MALSEKPNFTVSTLGIESIARPIIETDLLASAVVIAFSNYHTVAAAASEASRPQPQWPRCYRHRRPRPAAAAQPPPIWRKRTI